MGQLYQVCSVCSCPQPAQPEPRAPHRVTKAPRDGVKAEGQLGGRGDACLGDFVESRFGTGNPPALHNQLEGVWGRATLKETGGETSYSPDRELGASFPARPAPTAPCSVKSKWGGSKICSAGVQPHLWGSCHQEGGHRTGSGCAWRHGGLQRGDRPWPHDFRELSLSIGA